MSNLQVKDGAGAAKHLKSSGAGSDLDPHIPEHKETSAASILAAAQAIQSAAADIKAAVEGTLGVSGTVAVSSAPTTAITAAALPLPTGAATSAKQDTEIGHLATIAGVAGDALTDTELRAAPVPVSGTVTVQDGGGAITVDGTVAVTGVATAANQSTEIGHLATLAGAVAGTEVQVDVLTMPGITLGASELHLGEVGGKLVTVSTEMTRPADTTAYTAGDVVSNSTSATTPITLADVVRVNAGSGYIVRVGVQTDKKSITPRLRVHFFNASNPTLSVDNAAHQEKYADIGKYLGYVDTAAMATGTDSTNSDMSRGVNDACRLPIVAAAATRSIYAVLQTLDAFTPASGEKFTLTVSVDNN